MYEISRETGHKWIERFEAGGLPALEDRSHAAHLQPRRIAAAVEKRLIEARRCHPTWGPKKLGASLGEREPETSNDVWTLDHEGRFRTGDGAPFASTGAGRLSRLNVWRLKVGIEVERIEPGKPRQNGRHERMHRTLKAETTRGLRPRTDGRNSDASTAFGPTAASRPPREPAPLGR